MRSARGMLPRSGTSGRLLAGILEEDVTRAFLSFSPVGCAVGFLTDVAGRFRPPPFAVVFEVDDTPSVFAGAFFFAGTLKSSSRGP